MRRLLIALWDRSSDEVYWSLREQIDDRPQTFHIKVSRWLDNEHHHRHFHNAVNRLSNEKIRLEQLEAIGNSERATAKSKRLLISSEPGHQRYQDINAFCEIQLAGNQAILLPEDRLYFNGYPARQACAFKPAETNIIEHGFYSELQLSFRFCDADVAIDQEMVMALFFEPIRPRHQLARQIRSSVPQPRMVASVLGIAAIVAVLGGFSPVVTNILAFTSLALFGRERWFSEPSPGALSHAKAPHA